MLLLADVASEWHWKLVARAQASPAFEAVQRWPMPVSHCESLTLPWQGPLHLICKILMEWGWLDESN